MEQILVDEISSIGESYFSFKLKGAIVREGILKELCRLKDGKDTYHFNERDLEKMSDCCVDIFPWKWGNGYPQYSRLKRNDYIELMKYTFYWYIEKGEMAKISSCLTKGERNFQITWGGEEPKRPTYCRVPL